MVVGGSLKIPISSTRRCIGILLSSGTQRSIFQTPSLTRTFHVPDEKEANELKEAYPEPKALLSNLFQPLIVGDPSKAPVIHFSKGSFARVWNANLKIQWPNKFSVCGVHRNLDQAEENAYLIACELFFGAGLIQMKNGKAVPLTEEVVMKGIEDLTSSWSYQRGSATNFRIVTTQNMVDGEKAWHSEIKLTWPFCMSAHGEGALLKSAQYEACLRAFMMLKSKRVLDKRNNLIKSEILRFTTEPIAVDTKSNITSDFEIFVDASVKGYGAYLLNKEDNYVRWISDPWPEHINKYNKIPLVDVCSGFCELYALVCACYTWKHKFCDKSVLCWTDNKNVVEIINKGLYIGKEKRKNFKYAKLYVILRDTCKEYNIKLSVLHVNRLNNTAADHLSKFRVDQFREIVPTAMSKSKKTKKLLFWEPLVDLNISTSEDESDRNKK